jgi:hypothetical protein
MSATVTASKLLPSHGIESVTVTDDYGTNLMVSIPVTTSSADRTTHIDAAIATLNTNQAAMEAYAAANGVTLPPKRSA